jgi:phage shock protein PspC (stress-responsive transcriptional regulator)
MRELGRLRRSRTDRKIAGVSGGLGRHFDVDPTIIRVAFVVLAFFGGAGLLLYGVGWLLVPEDGDDRARVHLEPSTRSIVLIAFTVIAALMMVGDSGGFFDFPWPIAVLGVVVLSIMMSRKDRDSGRVSLTKDAPATEGLTTDSTRSMPTQPWQSAGQPVGPPAPPAPKPYRGPGLFWASVALIAAALGGLRLVELSGTGVPDGAYPALALGICGGMLVLGAWYGRAGGVLFLAILAGLGLGVANLAEAGIGDDEHHTPLTAAAVDSSYSFGIGQIELDLSEVSDVRALDGRTIRVHGNVGSLEVIVPDGVDVTATGEISGGGDVDIFGKNDDGDSPRLTGLLDGGIAAPQLTIDADLDLGTITVRTQ